MANVYRFVKDTYDGVESYACYTSSGISQGDMIQWDTGARKATPLTTASGAIFLGVSESAQPLAGLGSSTVSLTGDVVRVKSTGVHAMKTTMGETYVHLTPVFMGGDAQTVTNAGGQARLIGRCWVPGGQSITGASGVKVPVLIYGSMTNNSTAPQLADGAR